MKRTMKKNYIKPSILEFRFEAQPILAGSLNANEEKPSVTPDEKEEISGGFGSRRGTWDDDDDF